MFAAPFTHLHLDVLPEPEAVAGKQVLLVDDVMTTGATVRSAAGALLEGGAHRVWVLTLARAVPGVMT